MRKIRTGIPSANISKSDGLRIVYSIESTIECCILVRVYHKADFEKLRNEELEEAARQIGPILDELRRTYGLR